MTGRTCPVHGEYSASGVCRWCEDTVQMEYIQPFAHPPAGMAVKSATLDELAEIFGPPADLLPESYALRAIALTEARLKASNFSYYVLMVKHWHSELAAAEESRLLAQHTALRWERVARRWNYKHREPRWINEEWRAYVWRCWLEQMALRRKGNLIAAGIPKGWP